MVSIGYPFVVYSGSYRLYPKGTNFSYYLIRKTSIFVPFIDLYVYPVDTIRYTILDIYVHQFSFGLN